MSAIYLYSGGLIITGRYISDTRTMRWEIHYVRPQSGLTLFYAVVTSEIKLFQNYFSVRRRPSEIISFRRLETCLKLFQNYFRGLLQLVNIFQRVQCR